ncbi:alpha-glucosidase [Sphingomonas oleivorans]|uniref:Alpha-glucosidase n=2 Tax=Sphingomonas oleivorans TaxID=1735121 RepID=A0A2T5G366_9SPHN|nr:alpha-glucosidase [Sphingomonas oleivorans]
MPAVLAMLATLLLVAVPARAADWQSVSSPDGRLQIQFGIEEGRAWYRAAFKGRPILDKSLLGFRFKEQAPLLDGLAIDKVARISADSEWQQPWGEVRLVHDRYRGLRAELRETGGAQRHFAIEFRVYDDGFGFRYELPRDGGMDRFVIMDEATEFAFAQNYRAWWIPAYRDNYSEYEYARSALSALSVVQTPLTLEGDGVAMAVHEAALVDYASMNLRTAKDNGKTLKADLSPWSNGDRVRGRAGLKTPWRVVMVADDAARLAESTIILNLNEPSRIADTRWIRPEKYIGIFWAMHIGRLSWNSGPELGATTERTKSYIDWAAANGIPAVLVEGWNVGWDVPEWWKNGRSRFRQAEANPDFDMPAIAAYAKAKGVSLIGHHETGGQVRDYLGQMEQAFDYYDRHGVRAIKLGYVGTRLDETEWPDGQYAVESFQKVVEAAARHRIAIFPHEPVKDTGLRRTWPNLMSREGARGQEYNGGSPDTGNSPDHTSILPFTRLLSGPLDYTPGVFAFDYRARRPINRVPSTLAHQLALYLILYSPVQMAVDLPENYEGKPAFQFIRDVPTDWETSRVIAGAIGDYVAIARRDRHGPDWYLGAITNGEARTLRLPLAFLDRGRRYRAEIYADGPGADWRSNPEAVVIRAQEVTAETVLDVALAPGGGQAIRFRPL